MASGTSNKYGGAEETIQFFLGALFEIIVDRVDCQLLMNALPCDIISSVQEKKIRNIKQKDGPAAATKRILEIVKASKTPGKYQALVDALKKDYQILSKALTGHPLKDDSIQKNIIKVFSSDITERMSTIQLLPYLISSSVIVQLEKEMVEAELRNYGNIRAAELLLLHLPAHVENWYTEFLKALCDSGQQELAEFIDESFTQKYTTSSNMEVLKTDADAQLYLARKEDTDLSDDEIPKEVRIKEEKEEDETERKEMSPENTAYVYDSADGSLDDLCAPKPRSIKPELHGVGKDIHVAISRLKVNNPETSDLQARLDQIVLQHRHKLHKRGESEILHEEDPSDVSPDDSVLDDSLLDDDSLLAASSINETSCKHLDDSWSERQTPSVNRDSYLDSVASDEKEEVEIPLRKYQEELARPALQGKNVIIMAPTGSGKTRVAFKLIQDHFNQLRDKCAKVVLLVKDQALADQHGKTCQELLPKYRSQAINGDIKRDKGISLGDCIEKQDILVVTAQLLLNSLMEGEIKSITQFSLLIFDECHHCHDDHAYNKIMQLYRDIKLTPEADTSSLPQIIGLTASIGVGKANGILQAKEHIKRIMANMDAELISTVKDNLDELYQYVPKTSSDVVQASDAQAEDIIINVKSRENDAFFVSITSVMNTIEGMMRDAEVVKNTTSPPGYIKVLNAPSAKGSEAYIQWLSDMWNATVTVPDPKIRRFISPCYVHLKWYNNALIIYNDARVKDAADYLKKEINIWQEKDMDDNEQCLLMLYKACTSPKYVQEVPNPKLHKLKDLIVNSFRDKTTEESRCIVFVKTRHLAKALVDWMTEDSELNTLSPTVFVGTHAVRDKLGLTKVEQSDKLADFRSGKYKIMVATSVAEEGLDIEKCNLVLRYDHVTHEIAMVQSRGRARSMYSRYYVVAQEGKGTAQKEEINMMREELMQKAVSELKTDIQQDPQGFTKILRQIQDQEKLDREAKQKGNILAEGEYDLRCVTCDHFICKSYDIRQILNSHFVVIDPSFEQRIQIRRNRGFEDSQIKFIGKIFCGKCDEDFGQFCIYRLQKLPVIKIDKFVVVGQGGTPKKFKRWKQVPFKVPQLTIEDRKNLPDNQE
ncbi:hypothetical protein ACJMK2_004848 [Sinanodonta woodiana]|uniref:RNA helicase n=1 Tax=Sinanodonta woodiana TaxID=1069815 RepID=A0ABD3VNY0_SINWO